VDPSGLEGAVLPGPWGAPAGMGPALAPIAVQAGLAALVYYGVTHLPGWLDALQSSAKPNNCPVGTLPISETPWSKWHSPIKKGVGAGPKDWTGITPQGTVITGDENGEAVDHGPAEDYTPGGKTP
jgi:hypothetical protein